MNSSIQDDSRTDYNVYFVEYEDDGANSSTLLGVFSASSQSAVPPHTLNFKFSTVAIFFILLHLKILQRDKFPMEIAFVMTVNKAQGQTLNPLTPKLSLKF